MKLLLWSVAAAAIIAPVSAQDEIAQNTDAGGAYDVIDTSGAERSHH